MLLDIAVNVRLPILIVALIVVIARIYATWRGSDPCEKRLSVYGTFFASLKKVFIGWWFLVAGPNVMQQAYDAAERKPFDIWSPDTRLVFVSAPGHIKEVDSASDRVLSLHAATKTMLQPKFTMTGFNWLDERGIEGIGFVKAVRTLLTNNIPSVIPDIRRTISKTMSAQLAKHRTIQGARHSPIYSMIVEMTVEVNALVFFGKDVSANKEFRAAALHFIEDTLMIAEVIRLLPNFMAPIIGGMLSGYLNSHRKIFETLVPIAEQRMQEATLKRRGQKVESHSDCIQWIIETSPTKNPWTAERVVHELMALWFGSVHAIGTTTVFAIEDLCLHPEYVEPLRSELEGPAFAAFERTAQGLPLLDSFIKESARLTPLEAISTRRQALKPWSLSDGTKVNVGDWIVTPARSIMRDAAYYPEPLRFEGFRFADPKVIDQLTKKEGFNALQSKPSSLTDTGDDWQMWGTGRMTCPGRIYASVAMKLMLSHVLLDYDCRLIKPEASRYITWRSTTLPRSSTMVEFSPRQMNEEYEDAV